MQFNFHRKWYSRLLTLTLRLPPSGARVCTGEALALFSTEQYSLLFMQVPFPLSCGSCNNSLPSPSITRSYKSASSPSNDNHTQSTTDLCLMAC